MNPAKSCGRLVFAILALALVFGNFTTVLAVGTNSAAQTGPNPYANETPAQRDARMAWWREARFGMFIHWGVYSVPAGTYNGRQIPGIGEWIMNKGKIPMAEYQQFAKEFDPTNFNADDWVKTAKNAGMKYIVITAKHHDGFAMFDTKASPWNIMQATPFGRDPLKELAVACKKYGIKLGFYYSQAQDWNNGGSASGGKWDPAQQRDMDDYIDKIAVPQMKELLTHYGEFPAVIWWDTPIDMNSNRAAKLEALLKLKPGIISNNRLGGGFTGDTETPEQKIPATGYSGRDWETCMTMNDTWGYKSYDNNWKSTETLIRNLVDIASKGGNYLLNVGPTSEGLIPEPSIERLKAIGGWMKVNGEAIYGTTASPFQRLPWGRATKKISGNHTTLYLHVFNWPTDGKLLVPGLENKITSAKLLASGKKIKTSVMPDGVVVDVPANAPDPISSTVVLQFKGTPDVSATSIIQKPDGSVRLPAFEAELHGAIQYETGNGKDNIGYWTNPDDFAGWTFSVNRPGKFQVAAEIASLGAGQFEIVLGGQNISGTAPNTGDYTKFQNVNLAGTLEIAAPGIYAIAMKPVKTGWQPVNLKSLTLKPATN
jgi:alpha-L-fucosidase